MKITPYRKNLRDVAIVNKELVVVNINSSIVEIIISLLETKSCNDCYFNRDKWFTLLQYIGDNTTLDNIDKTKLYLYGAEWFDYFTVNHNKLVVFNKRENTLLEKLVKHYDKRFVFTSYVYYTSVKKNVREQLDILFDYKNVITYLFSNTWLSFDNLPKGWKDNLPRLNSFLDTDLARYLNQTTLTEQINTVRQINKQVKSYGKIFLTVLKDSFVNLNDEEDVRQKTFLYLRQNNRLLVDPISTTFSTLGKWTIVELNTKLSFIDESAVQNHCIGRGDYYINRVVGGDLRAFSFRKINGEKETRYTVTYIKENNHWEVEQDKGFNNRDKSRLYSGYDLKCLEVNIERLKKELDKFELNNKREVFI